MFRRFPTLLLACLVLAACSDDSVPFYGFATDTATDGGETTDADPDARSDAAAEDGGTDAGEEDGGDPDTGDDAGGPDTGTDTGPDTDLDGGGNDAGDDAADGGACSDACEEATTGCGSDAEAWLCERSETTGCLERRPVPCVNGTFCEDGSCGCPTGFCSVRGTGEFCEGLAAVACSERNGCAVEVEREVCDVACDAGACDCPSTACAGSTAAFVCDGRTRVGCESIGSCRVEASRETCAAGCDAGECQEAPCGAFDEPCCAGGFCDSGLLCASGTCELAPELQTIHRYENVCDPLAHWHSTGECFPGPTGATACFCESRVVNPSCAEETCWSNQGGFRTYATEPAAGDYSPLFHCFDETSNSYQIDTPCVSPGWPHELGWVANSPAGSLTVPVYLCRLTSEVANDEFFTRRSTECAELGYALVDADTGLGVGGAALFLAAAP